MNFYLFDIAMFKLDGKIEVGNETRLQSDVAEDKFSIEEGKLNVLSRNAKEYLFQELIENNSCNTFKYHIEYSF